MKKENQTGNDTFTNPAASKGQKPFKVQITSYPKFFSADVWSQKIWPEEEWLNRIGPIKYLLDIKWISF